MNESTDDWREQLEAARKEALAAGDKAVGSKLSEINKQADDLSEIFQRLKLTDKTTYDQLIAIVDDATRLNEAIGEVATRVAALGKAVATIAERITSLTPVGALRSLSGGILGERGAPEGLSRHIVPGIDHLKVQAPDEKPIPELIYLGHQGPNHLSERPLPFVSGHADLQSTVSQPQRSRGFRHPATHDLGPELP